MCIWSLTDSRRLVAERILQILVQQHRWFTVWFDWQNSLSRFSLVIRSSVFICIKLNQCICYWSELKLPFCFTLSRYKFTFQQIYLYAKPIVNILIITVLSLSRTFTTCLDAEKLLNHILMADFLNIGRTFQFSRINFGVHNERRIEKQQNIIIIKTLMPKLHLFVIICSLLISDSCLFNFFASLSLSLPCPHILISSFFLLLIKKLW